MRASPSAVAFPPPAPITFPSLRTAPSRRPTRSHPLTTTQESTWAPFLAPRKAGEHRFWLVKSEPSVFSFDDLLRAPRRTTHWDGVRNFTARNFLRDGMKRGDQVFFYHSSTDPSAIVGICEVVKEAYPDRTALDPTHPGYDEDSDPAAPRWFAVDLQAVERLHRPVPLPELKGMPELKDMALLRIGRLSVTPVRPAEWKAITRRAAK